MLIFPSSISDCSQMLLCVLVVNPQVDPGTQIHCHLIDAFCWDVRIPVLRVDSARKLRHVTGMSFAHPVHCLLVKVNLVCIVLTPNIHTKYHLLNNYRVDAKNGLSDSFGPPFIKPQNYLLSCNAAGTLILVVVKNTSPCDYDLKARLATNTNLVQEEMFWRFLSHQMADFV